MDDVRDGEDSDVKLKFWSRMRLLLHFTPS